MANHKKLFYEILIWKPPFTEANSFQLQFCRNFFWCVRKFIHFWNYTKHVFTTSVLYYECSCLHWVSLHEDKSCQLWEVNVRKGHTRPYFRLNKQIINQSSIMCPSINRKLIDIAQSCFNVFFKYYKSRIVWTVFDIPGRDCIDHR